jgi:hypothetical protein
MRSEAQSFMIQPCAFSPQGEKIARHSNHIAAEGCYIIDAERSAVIYEPHSPGAFSLTIRFLYGILFYESEG